MAFFNFMYLTFYVVSWHIDVPVLLSEKRVLKSSISISVHFPSVQTFCFVYLTTLLIEQ